MDINYENLPGGVTVMKPSGRLNMASGTQFRDAVRALTYAGTANVAVDLSEVEFIDSSGLGALISGLKAARQSGGDLRIVAPTEQVQLVLQLTNMDRVLVAHPDVATAFPQ